MYSADFGTSIPAEDIQGQKAVLKRIKEKINEYLYQHKCMSNKIFSMNFNDEEMDCDAEVNE